MELYTGQISCMNHTPLYAYTAVDVITVWVWRTCFFMYQYMRRWAQYIEAHDIMNNSCSLLLFFLVSLTWFLCTAERMIFMYSTYMYVYVLFMFSYVKSTNFLEIRFLISMSNRKLDPISIINILAIFLYFA